MSTYLKCICPSCSQPIEYPTELASQVTNCPTCSQPLQLPSGVPKTGVFERLLEKWKHSRQHAKDKKQLKAELIAAVADGLLYDEEIQRIQEIEQATGLTNADWLNYRTEIYEHAVDGALKRGYLSPDREEQLRGIQAFLGVTAAEAAPHQQRITKSGFMFSLKAGQLPPPIHVSGVVLDHEENAYWIEPATLYEERVVSRRYEGGSRGVSLRLMKGVSVRVGAHRGQLISDSANVPIASGSFVITNRRLIFSGDAKSFATKLEKIIDLTPHLDGLRYAESNRQKPRALSFPQKNGDIVCELLQIVMRNRA
jgi:hypothetical protein